MTALLVIGIIIGVLALLLSFSATLYVHLTDNLSVRAGAFGIKLWLLNPNEEEEEEEPDKSDQPTDKKSRKEPAAEEKNQPKQDGKAPPKEDKPSVSDSSPAQSKGLRGKLKGTVRKTLQKNPKAKKDINELIYTILDVAKAALHPAGYLLRHLRITALDVRMSIGAEDAADTATTYAGISSGLYYLLGILKSQIVLKIKRVELNTDFITGEIRQDISFKVKIRLGVVLFAGLCMIKNFLVNNMKKDAETSAG